MKTRILALTATLIFSTAPLAQGIIPGSEQQFKLMLACSEVETAKHISVLVPLALLTALSAGVAEQLEPYENVMKTAKSCPEFAAAYNLIVKISKETGTDPEAFFETPEGKKELEELIAELQKIKI